MSTKKTYSPLMRSLKCSICGEVEYSEYNYMIWQLDDRCPVCLPIRKAHPEVFDWVVRVIENQKMTKDDVRDIVENINSGGPF